MCPLGHKRKLKMPLSINALYSADTPRKFISVLQETYTALEISPMFRIRYKNVRSLKIKNFPYSLFFIVDDVQRLFVSSLVFTIKGIRIKDLEFRNIKKRRDK